MDFIGKLSKPWFHRKYKYLEFQKRGITLAGSHIKYLMHIYTSYWSCVESLIWITWKLWEELETQIFKKDQLPTLPTNQLSVDLISWTSRFHGFEMVKIKNSSALHTYNSKQTNKTMFTKLSIDAGESSLFPLWSMMF